MDGKNLSTKLLNLHLHILHLKIAEIESFNNISLGHMDCHDFDEELCNIVKDATKKIDELQRARAKVVMNKVTETAQKDPTNPVVKRFTEWRNLLFPPGPLIKIKRLFIEQDEFHKTVDRYTYQMSALYKIGGKE